MMFNRYIVSAGLLIFFVVATYAVNFYIRLGYGISVEPEVWGQLGDYLGGVLNPMLSFISIVLLIRSLGIQNEANTSLRDEISNTRKTERLRSFEAQLFNMISAQRESFHTFLINDGTDQKTGAEAVIFIEEKVEQIRGNSKDPLDVVNYLDLIDPADQIFGLTRIFYNMVKITSEKLSDANGFDEADREAHYLTILNFTDFALLRLVMISGQFLDYKSTDYLKNHKHFNSVLIGVGLGFNLY